MYYIYYICRCDCIQLYVQDILQSANKTPETSTLVFFNRRSNACARFSALSLSLSLSNSKKKNCGLLVLRTAPAEGLPHRALTSVFGSFSSVSFQPKEPKTNLYIYMKEKCC
jgi:hypothetical protein